MTVGWILYLLYCQSISMLNSYHLLLWLKSYLSKCSHISVQDKELALLPSNRQTLFALISRKALEISLITTHETYTLHGLCFGTYVSLKVAWLTGPVHTAGGVFSPRINTNTFFFLSFFILSVELNRCLPPPLQFSPSWLLCSSRRPHGAWWLVHWCSGRLSNVLEGH